jgi:nicotinate phosphoribosyltransferase
MISTNSLLLTDLYQLAMLEGYQAAGMHAEACFEFFVRELPPGYGYLIAAGLPSVLETLADARFTDEEMDWIVASGRFGPGLVDYLRRFRFTGSVHAMHEGTVFFPDEPVLRVTGPISEAQLLETRIINLMQYQILVATKATRCVGVAVDKLLVDFGLRRAHGAEAGLLAARSAYLGGFGGSSNVLAAARFGVPIYGTMAHSFIEAHDDELRAFENFARARPKNLVLLIDTYDTEAAARKLISLAKRLDAAHIQLQAVRIDSGDLAEHALRVRRILDAGSLKHVRIFASGGLDEHRVRDILAAGAPVDGFGIGSKLDTSADAPYLDCAYKLTEYAGKPRRKQSEEKATWPGRKQVYRHYDGEGRMRGDEIALASERRDGEPLLQCVIRDGEPTGTLPSLRQARDRVREQLQRLPPALRALDAQPGYPVTVTEAVRALAREADAFIARQAAAAPES